MRSHVENSKRTGWANYKDYMLFVCCRPATMEMVQLLPTETCRVMLPVGRRGPELV